MSSPTGAGGARQGILSLAVKGKIETILAGTLNAEQPTQTM